ncbi:hypothetical protein CRG98_031330 [Punica granatum]|uniref:Uncharacterized protein n=1 Tax=Punica granatum TaxID=22663 RepID=A0A2I0IW76_PUNGR|nr:hypothetical protein CRG98_031330 [Punica granatum]
MKIGIVASNRRPRTLHLSRRRPLWAPATSMEVLGSPIGGPDPESTWNFDLEVLGRYGMGAANQQPRHLHRGRRRPLGHR